MTTDEEAQQDEMLALESIFDNDTFKLHAGDIVSGSIKIKLEVPDPFYVAAEVDQDDENNLVLPGMVTKYKVDYLPPLMLHFTLPKNYPSQSKPNFTLSSNWLHRACLSVLCQKLDNLWEENKGMGVLFTWANYLQANALNDLGIGDLYDVDWHRRPANLTKKGNFLKRRKGSLEDSRIQDVSGINETEEAASPSEPEAHSSKSPKKRKSLGKKRIPIDSRAASDPVPRLEGKETQLVAYLLFYNEEENRETFIQGNHTCDICFSLKSGHQCVRFLCGHAFCEECVGGFYTTNITEGTVDQVKCLAFNCKMRPAPEVVKKLVGDELYERYDQILLKRALESMSDVTYCPRPKCLNPVICDPSEKCARCTVCSYTFCSCCKMVYHGVEPCRLKGADMMEVYKKFSEGSAAERKAILKTYGKKQLQHVVENILTEEWIQKESKQCPHCKVPIEKFEGCNKVTCFKCNTYFCWLCLKQLEHGNPYFHFNDPSSKCYNNLFQNVGEEEEDNGWIGAGIDDVDSDDDDDFDYGGPAYFELNWNGQDWRDDFPGDIPEWLQDDDSDEDD